MTSGRGADFSIRCRRVVLPGGVAPASLTIRDGRIDSVRVAVDAEESPPGGEVEGRVAWDLGDLVVLPGLVDTHVHVNEPGRTEWEGFETAGRAAAAGGVTTLVDMPLNCDPVTADPDALERKRAAAARSCIIDYGFWAGLVPDSVDRVEALREAGALGFKAFMVDSGLPEFPPVGRAELGAAMPRIAAMGLPLLVHAEDPLRIGAATRRAREGVVRDPALVASHLAWIESRPPEAEAAAIDLLAELAASTGCHTHVVHVSSAEALTRVAAAKARGASLTAETCPHYLALDGTAVPAGAVEYKCAPPIRGLRHRDALWRGLRAGVLDLVATDHSPCPPRLKTDVDDGFFGAWGGISSLGLALPILWSQGSERELSLADVVRWMSAEPARLAGIRDRKGTIAEGMDADLAIFDPEAEFEVGIEHLRFRHPMTPYLGMRMKGRIVHTLSRGRLVFSADSRSAPPSMSAGYAAGADGGRPPGGGAWLR